MERLRFGKLITGILAATAFLLAAPLPRATAADTPHLRVSYGGIAGYQVPLWVNHDAGIYKKYGFDLRILMIRGGSANIQALLGGSINMTQSSAISGVQAALRGAPVVIVETSDNKIPFQMLSRPEIKNPEQLKGKKIGIVRFGGSNDIAVKMALKAWKIPLREVTVLQAGGATARMAALSTGRIDATVQSYPQIYEARKLGMNVLADIGDFGPYTNSSLMVTRAYLREHRGLINRMIKAQIDAIHYIKTNKAGTMKILGKYVRVSDPKTLELTYDFFSKRIPRIPRTDPAGMKNLLEAIGAGQKDPARFTDMSLLDKIVKEGFVDKLYGR